MSDPKTPRDWLLSRHASATPQLDALRRSALPARALTWRDLPRELFGPQRHVWRLLTATWIVLAIFQLTLGRAPSPRFPAPSPVAVAAWFAQLNSYETFVSIDRHR